MRVVHALLTALIFATPVLIEAQNQIYTVMNTDWTLSPTQDCSYVIDDGHGGSRFELHYCVVPPRFEIVPYFGLRPEVRSFDLGNAITATNRLSSKILELLGNAEWEWNKHLLFPPMTDLGFFTNKYGYDVYGHITADRKLYLAADRVSECMTGRDFEVRWQQVIMHEMGHLLGLLHNGDLTDIMYPVVEPSAWIHLYRRRVSIRDVEQLNIGWEGGFHQYDWNYIKRCCTE